MYDNKFSIKYGIIYDTTYGYGKRYRCANPMLLLSILEFTQILIIDRCINAPDHGRIKIDGIYGYKKYLNKNVHDSH